MEKPAHKHYEHFGSGDLICDPFFQDWVLDANETQHIFWQEFMAAFPHKKTEVEAARDFLRQLAFRESFPEPERVELAYRRHLEQIAAVTKDALKRKRGVTAMWWAAAAAVVGIVALTLFFERGFGGREKVNESTAFGIKKQVMLPDGSTVVLNANSSVSFGKDWNGAQPREVWLKGEGYFDVKKSGNNTGEGWKFLVHTGALTVEVLGTRFDIRERRGVTEVVLEEGKIALSFLNKAHKGVRMTPGQMVVYDPQKGIKEIDTTNAVHYTAWKKNKLILRNPTVAEIALYLEDNFGYKIVLEKEEMGTKKIEGPILYDNLNDVLFILSTVLHTEVIRKDSTIILRPR
ncbi:MAG: FecR family protein [Chitinophagaceae bacterium]